MKFHDGNGDAWQVWRLIPEKFEERAAPLYEQLGLGPLPPYNEQGPGQPAHDQRVEIERDDFGTVVTEVNIVTTRKKYRVDNS